MELPEGIQDEFRLMLQSLPDGELRQTYLREWRVWDFLRRNRDESVTHSNGIMLSFHQATPDSEIEMSILVDSNTTRDAISEAWAFIDRWRARLQQYQGQDDEENFTSFFFRYLQSLHDSGYSFGEIATLINESIAEYLREGNEQLKHRSPDKPSPTPIVCAAGLMALMGLDEDTTRALIMDGLDNIQNGRPVFPRNSPIDYERVKQRLRRPPKKVRGVQVLTLYWDWLMTYMQDEQTGEA